MKTRFKLLSARSEGRTWFWWGISLGAFLAVVTWWWLENQNRDQEDCYLQRLRELLLPDVHLETEESPLQAVEAAPARPAVDDLRKIEGLGPKSAQILVSAGVTSFSQLAKMDPKAIKELLRTGGVRLGSVETWPEQAALAAEGRWEELEALQTDLKYGRRK